MDLRIRIAGLNKEIKNYFYLQKTKNVRRGIIPGSSKSLWSAVRIAEDTTMDAIPDKMIFNNVTVTGRDVADSFPLTWLGLSFETFKVKCKGKLL